jgi:hypothetical protein
MDGPRDTSGAGGRVTKFDCQIAVGRYFEHLAARKYRCRPISKRSVLQVLALRRELVYLNRSYLGVSAGKKGSKWGMGLF